MLAYQREEIIATLKQQTYNFQNNLWEIALLKQVRYKKLPKKCIISHNPLFGAILKKV